MQDSDEPEVATFLAEMLRGVARSPLDDQAPHSAASIQASLEWQRRNPARPAGAPTGLVLRGHDGRVAGTHLCLPQRFTWGARAFVGLCASAYFAAPDARRDVLGPSILFLEYLRLPGFDFRFATTCNARSGPFWQSLGAAPIHHSEFEYLVPLRVGPLAAELIRRWKAGAALASAAGVLASLAQPIVDHRRRWSPFRVMSCPDWERLASLSAACRDPNRVTSLRTADYLAWRYGEYPARDLLHIHLMMERGKDVGWFALLERRRGVGGLIRSCTLVDLVWHPDRGGAVEALQAVIATGRPRFDLLSVRPRPLLGDAPLSLGARVRRLPGPTTYVYGGPDTPARRPELFDLVPGDGDTAM